MQLPQYITKAIASYLEGNASSEEKEIVHKWYYSFNDEDISIPAEIAGLREKLKSRMKARLDKMITDEKVEAIIESANIVIEPRRWYKRIAIAASIILAVGISGYFIMSGKQPSQNPISKVQTTDLLPPDKTRATITLTNGKVIYLDSASNGTINIQNNVALIKNAANEIVYSGDETSANSQLAYHTLYNPKASQPVALTLTDGTKVWLNSESSLRYPIAFNGNERKVEITGEAYFEVAKDPSKKFIVDAAGKGEVEVLGTHFNINSYNDENEVKVTLLEGSVKTSIANLQTEILKPGQQAIIANNQLSKNNKVNVEQVMAWKNGLFHFEGTDLQTVMRQIQRWYNVNVLYEKKISQTFYGNITRQSEASKVFRMLELTEGVHFEIKGNTVIVKP